MSGNTVVVTQDETRGPSKPACTAIDNDWGDDRPNMLMFPPCACPRCVPDAPADIDERSWLQLFGRTQRLRVESAELGETGRALLG